MSTPIIVFLLLKNSYFNRYINVVLICKGESVIVLSLKSMYMHTKMNYNIFWQIEQDEHVSF